MNEVRRTTLYIPVLMMKRLKIIAVEKNTTLTEIIRGLIEEYLEKDK